MIAAIVGAQNGRLNYFAELETAGKCLEWVKDHLVLDEIDIFLEKTDVASSKESIYTSLYDYMSHVINKIPAGSGGVIFTPWLHGNRCPFEDPPPPGNFFGGAVYYIYSAFARLRVFSTNAKQSSALARHTAEPMSRVVRTERLSYIIPPKSPAKIEPSVVML